MKNVLKIVFLGIMGFSLLVYLTAPKKIENDNKNVQIYEMKIDNLPKIFEVVGKSSYSKIEEFFKKGEEKYLIVLNHDSIYVFKDLYKYTNKNIVLIANISNTPWLIKQIAVNDKLEELYNKSSIPLINDDKGNFLRSLNITDNKQNAYFVYKLNSNGKIDLIKKDFIKLGALEKGISVEESKKALEEISKAFN